MPDRPPEFSAQFIAAWQVYIAFYTVFLTVNLAALGVTLEKVAGQKSRVLIAAAFVAQNLLGMATAMAMARYSGSLGSLAGLGGDPLLAPLRPLGRWAGTANATSHLVLAALWIIAAAVGASEDDDSASVAIDSTRNDAP